MSLPPTVIPLSPRDLYGRAVIENHQREHEGEPAPPGPPTPRGGEEANDIITVGILGAGVAGLFAAMLLDSINEELHTNIRYEILEADEKRVGGRLYTHRFEGGGIDDYYDVGAMRFPLIPFMQPTFDLIQTLGLDQKLIPYVMENDKHNLQFFNGIRLKQSEATGTDPFHTGVPGLTNTASNMVDAQLGHFKKALVDNFDAGWDELKKEDDYSTRTYMKLKGTKDVKYSEEVITYLETFQTSSNLYDCAFVESVMDSLDFDYADNVKWCCLHGGTQQIAEAMADKIKGKVKKGRRVTSIAFNNYKGNPGSIYVEATGETKPLRYNHVISTLPFSCLRTVDTKGMNFSWELQTAIRTLHYDNSVKVAIRFKERWWESTSEEYDYLNQRGGISTTDLPTRTVVYPSYGIGQTTGATMIVSYTWAQDAARFGALVKGHDSDEEKILVDLILSDLATMHNVQKSWLHALMEDYHAFNWYGEQNSAGAFALFGPSQFSKLFTEVTKPHGGLMHFAGEATSVHHAWIVGSLRSAFRTVQEILEFHGMESELEKFNVKHRSLEELESTQIKRQVELGRARAYRA